MRICKTTNGQAVASVLTDGKNSGEYVVEHLSTEGALFIGSVPVEEGSRIQAFLHRIGHPSLLVEAEVIYCEPISADEYSLVVTLSYQSSRTAEVLEKMALFGVRYPAACAA